MSILKYIPGTKAFALRVETERLERLSKQSDERDALIEFAVKCRTALEAEGYTGFKGIYWPTGAPKFVQFYIRDNTTRAIYLVRVNSGGGREIESV